MDIDLDTPAVVSPDGRSATRGGGPLGADPAPSLVVRVAPPAPRVAPRAGEDQVAAAAELVRLGLATRVVLVNAPVDAALPEEWEIRGTAVHLERLDGGRTVVALGPAPSR